MELTLRAGQESRTIAVVVSNKDCGVEGATYKNPRTPSSLLRHLFRSILGTLKPDPTEQEMVKELPSSSGPAQRSCSGKMTSAPWRRDREVEVPAASLEIETVMFGGTVSC